MRWPNRTIFLSLFVLLLLSTPLSSQADDSQTATFMGKVVRVSDGDTISAMREGPASGEQIPSVWCMRITGGTYHMISFPYIPEDGDVLGDLVDDLGPYNKALWRFFRYDPVQSRYIELKTQKWGDVQNFDFGWGYWIISSKTAEICVEGEPARTNWIILEHEGDGWNQIGNIFDYDFPVADLWVCPISRPDICVQLIDPINNDLTYVTLQEFEDGSYIDIPATGKTTLEVGKGYWLRVRSGAGEDVILWFEVRASSTLSGEIHFTEEFFEQVAQQEDPPDPPPDVESSFSASFNGESGGSASCFVATTLYRNHDHPHVQVLRKFRDQYLSANRIGRIFVMMYYRWSPIIASFVARWKPIDTLVRFTLLPIIGFTALVSKMYTYRFLMVFGLPFLGSLFLLKTGILRGLKRGK
jgi:hypothetical protein